MFRKSRKLTARKRNSLLIETYRHELPEFVKKGEFGDFVAIVVALQRRVLKRQEMPTPVGWLQAQESRIRVMSEALCC